MKISCIQFAPNFRDLHSNLDYIEQRILESDADLIVFPELSTSGYFFHTRDEALPFSLSVSDSEVTRLIDVSTSNKKVSVIGFAERADSQLFNSALICGFNTPTTVYRKTHLFYREVDVFSPGDTGFQVAYISHLDCCLGTMICYDWRFPESARTLALRGADVIVCPSNLITHIWHMVMPVRALENKVFLAVANRNGEEVNHNEPVVFNGQSTIYGYNGNVLAAADSTTECAIFADIDPALTRNKSFNPYNNIISDRRPEFYE